MPFDSTPGALDDMEWIRLAQYWAGECDAAESVATKAWLDADPARRAAAQAVREVWEASAGADALAAGDPDRAWETIRSRLRVPHPPSRRVPARVGADRFGRLQQVQRISGPLGAIAAAVVVAVALGYVVDIASHRAPGVAGGRAYVTAAGQSETIRLADGTEFTLAPGSRLRLAADYGTTQRNVLLEGEATFAVVHDAQRPFVVRVGRALAKDIGTRFDVRGYAGEPSVRVVVAEGQVAVGQAGAAHERPLRTGDMATIADTALAITHGVDVDAYLGWTAGRLTFEQTPLPAAAAELARWYGVTITVGDATMRARHVSITLERQSLAAALDVVALAVGGRIARQGTTYTFIAAGDAVAPLR